MLALLRRARALAAVGAAGLVLSLGPAAHADSTADAQKKAQAILLQVQKIQDRVAAAEQAYGRSLAGVARAVTLSSLTDRAQEQLAAATTAADDALDNRVRGLYMSGGPLAIYATLLQSGDITDFQNRAVLVNNVVSSDQLLIRADQAVVAQASAQASRADRQATRQIATARNVQQSAESVLRLLADQQRLLDAANARVTHFKELDAARAALAAQSAAFSSITVAGLANLQLLAPSPLYLSLYHRAARTCPGLSWTVLAAIGQVESGHGRNPSTSYAGAMGPMQFLPATFAAYGVDGNADGRLDIMDPYDAIFTAAAYLCANGAGAGDPASLYRAIWHYNHADWYVQMVLSLSKHYVGYAG